MSRLSRDMRMWRACFGRTQQQAADELGVSLKTWQRWERDESAPEVSNFRELRELLAQNPRGWLRNVDPGDATDA